jgi:Ion channel
MLGPYVRIVISAESGTSGTVAEFRYAAVLALIFAVVVLLIVSPDGRWSRAVAFAMVAAALIVAVSTSRAPSAVRHRRATIGSAVCALFTLGILTGVVSRDTTLVVSTIVTLAVPVTLTRGVLRLVREEGATLQAVAGGLAIYLLVGLGFASAIGFVAAVGPSDYFAQGTNGSASQHVYYSFTTLTTTGFGDLTAAHRVGRALAVIEMLVGQIYLVTIIGILIGRRVASTR